MDLKNIKDLVANDKSRIDLHDKVAVITNDVISKINDEQFSDEQDWSDEEFKKRIDGFEEITSDLCTSQVLISCWGRSFHSQTIALPFQIIADYCQQKSSRTVWTALQWYNNLLLLYYTGIGAMVSGRYENLKTVTAKVITDPKRSNSKTTMLQAIVGVNNDFQNQFQLISGDTNHKVPRSEYLYKLLKPKFEKFLFLGSDYESYFDKFEIMLTLEYAHQAAGESPEYARGPIGRFGYKRRGYDNPFSELIEEANKMGDDWAPLRSGLLDGSFSRFKKISNLLEKRLKNPNWAF